MTAMPDAAIEPVQSTEVTVELATAVAPKRIASLSARESD